MPREAQDRQRRAGPPKIPQTLSLPIIPANRVPGAVSRPTGASQVSRPVRPDVAPPSRPRTNGGYSDPHLPRTPALLPSTDAWDDPYTYQPASDRDYGYDDPAATGSGRAVMSVPVQGMSRPSGPQRSLGSLALPLHLGAPPPRPLRRTLMWQMMLALVALIAMLASVRSASPPASAYASAFQGKAAVQAKPRIVDQVPIQTQLDPTIGYDSPAQYNQYSLAACGAAATSSVLLAWGDPQGRIGQVIDDMQPYIQPIGMVDPPHGFAQVAKRHHFNALITNNITAAQLAYIVSVDAIPVVVGIRDNNGGYYRYFDTGHFLVVVGADANGFQVVDNSTYFVHYFPTATFLSLWDYPRATIYTPASYNFQMP